MKSKILIVFILVFTLIACSSCQYTKDENTDNTDASSQNSDVKYYTQEELSKIEIEIPSYIYFVEKDSVDEYERERSYLLQIVYADDGDFEDDEAWKYL